MTNPEQHTPDAEAQRAADQDLARALDPSVADDQVADAVEASQVAHPEDTH